MLIRLLFLAEITPPGYDLSHKPRVGQRGGGVAALIKSTYTHSIISTPTFTTFEHIAVSVSDKTNFINFVTIYRPPHTPIAQFLDEFENLAGLLASSTSPTLFCGDFNIWVESNSSASDSFAELLESLDLSQHVDFPTNKFGHTLDLLIAPSGFDRIEKLGPSSRFCDHISISATLSTLGMSVPTKSPNVIKFRNFKKINLSELRNDLLKSDLICNPKLTADCLYEQYSSDLASLLEKHAPYTTKAIKKSPVDWISPSIIYAKRVKRQLERAWRRCPTPANKSKLNKHVHYYNRLVSSAKSKAYSDKINKSKGNSKLLWREINSILHRSPVLILPDSSDDKTLANKFASFFDNKITDIHSSFSSVSESTSSPNSKPNSWTHFNQVTEEEVLKIMRSSPAKHCLLDPWPTFLLLEFIDILIVPITNFINSCLNEGIYPDCFKRAIVTPLIKKPSLPPDELKNYRPVSNLNYLSKLLERVVARQLKTHIDQNSLDNHFQSAYKAGHSTETALLKIKNDIHLNFAHGSATALVLLDLSAAFDTIEHALLLERLSDIFGLGESVLNWFASYLHGRTLSVKVKDTLSELIPLSFGVPQGSVLGPILFTMYTSPLSKLVSSYGSLQHHLYADDTQIYAAINRSNAQTVLTELSDCLGAVQSWMNANKLKLNPTKTEFIMLGNKTHHRELATFFPTDILGNLLSPCDKVRNLGVIFDKNFSLSKHVSSVSSRCFYHIRDLARIRRHLDTPTAIIVANALVSSILDYCNSLLFSLTVREKYRLQKIQNTLCRIITRTPRRSSITGPLKSLHWLPVKQRISFKTNVLTYKALSCGLPGYIKSCVQPYTSARDTRRSNPSKLILDTPFYDRKLHSSKLHLHNSFSYSAPRLWNEIPLDIRSAPSVSSFRKLLKSHLFSQAYPP